MKRWFLILATMFVIAAVVFFAALPTIKWVVWEIKYFGHVGVDPHADLDGDGIFNLQEYLNGTDPNKIRFRIEMTNNYVKMSTPAQLEITKGVPFYKSVLVDSTNFVAATWTAYTSSNVTVNLGTNGGWHEVWIGLRGLPSDAQQRWEWKRLKLDLTPPRLFITNPTNSVVDQPMIQLRGYCPEALAEISYDLTNAAGMVSNQQVLILDQFYDTNTFEFTTNTFQAFDVEVTSGVNTFTFHAADLAGNVTTTNISFTLDYAGKTNPPVVHITWPQDGMKIGGGKFTLMGWVDDPTATVILQAVGTNGTTNTFYGLVEVTGKIWVENISLGRGTNPLSLIISDAAGNFTVTNLSISQSQLVLTLNPVGKQLWQPTANIGGKISDPTYAVWVSGVKGTNHGDGTWSADNVPVNEGGTAVFDINAYSPDERQPDGSYGNQANGK